ncbi:HAD-IA family hydrolase [Dactylosporangium aurantiacum]|uniref:HAD-IA family hydrolase n=1 Tax=Dactylosporangium aurantiacum TaxID=35754 RepID=A0A9Q9IL78_9ACTN|nr:HAD-IA family hydrolase [Dactylosporangium aurantiacum]MDG6106308.1 HAD-IA family hydrolase [Dactylosporangium aurantiacum]UWZ58199.1 HAD-IA family hydrolase [Dactylosporangium aurantiacum]
MSRPVTHTDYDAVLFDLEGVLTATRSVRAAAWRRTFEEFLSAWDAGHGTRTTRFDERTDYAAHLDSRPCHHGVRDFLSSRGIELPEGSPDARPEEESVWGVSNRERLIVGDELERAGVEAFPGSVAWVRELREAGLRTAVVSSSRDCAAILRRAGIANLFDVRVDGATALDHPLAAKPAPDAFLEAARQLGVAPGRAVVVEDTVTGVRAGRAGAFGLVVGVDRDGHAEQLTAHGADVVVADLGELLAASTEDVHRAGPRRHRLLAAAERIIAETGDRTVDPWRLRERVYNPGYVEQTETLFAVSNGYLGIRASFEEGEPSFRPGTMLNGFHETWPIVYPEPAHGFATTGQTIVRVPDGTTIRLFVDDDPVTCETTEVRQFDRALDMRRGVLDRSVVHQLPDGRRFRVDTRRFASLAQRHMACLRYEVTALDGPGHLVLSSELLTPRPAAEGQVVDPRQSRALAEGALEPGLERAEGVRVIRTYRTARGGLVVAAAMDHEFDERTVTPVRTKLDGHRAAVAFEAHARPGQTITLTKWLAYHYGAEDAADLADRAAVTLYRARGAGWASALADHERMVAQFWQRSEVVWDGSPAAQQALHFSLFSILQAALRSEGHGVPAKGLTGTGYEGHYFWDTEAYVLPFLTHTAPNVARSLLMHRIRMLPAARRRAREVGCAGALFPWRTINGDEASAYYAAGTAQYHIDADIAYALAQYVTVTGDTDLLFRHGAELLVETARMWAGLGFLSPRHGGRFVIHKVTGPDEYTTVVDNNLFTNLMAAENLTLAADAVDRVRTQSPPDFRRLVERTGLREDEPATWRRAAERMYLPYDETAGVHLQDAGFLDQAPWDFAGTPPECYPLLLHYHPLVIYRHQVIKQADVVLATVLLPDRFTAHERRRIFEYYDPLTTGDSSLSECIQAIAAADAGKYRSAEEYLVDAAAVDMADTAGNLRDGVHVASAGGTWMAVVYGFAGYRWRPPDGPQFSPMLPTRARRLRFPLMLHGSVLDVDIEEHRVTYTVRSGDPVTARHRGEPFTVAAGSPVSFAGDYHTYDAAPGTAPPGTA